MSNMSYCRFENTSRDLDDCIDALEDFRSIKELKEESMEGNEYEQRGVDRFVRLIKKAHSIIEDMEE